MAAQAQQLIDRMPGFISSFRERLSHLRPWTEFADVQRISRPTDMNEATTRISHNTRHFSGNYSIFILILAVYSLLSNPWLLLALGFLVGGFVLINRFAPEPVQVGDQMITQKTLYTALFVIGIPLLWFASPLSTFFYLVGSSSVLILGHAALLEPSVESEYATVESV